MRTVGITGHQKAPEVVWQTLADQLPSILGPPPFVGVSSLAVGADQEFARTVLRLGGDLIAIIPSSHYGTSFETAEQREQYQFLLKSAKHHEQLPFDRPNEDAYLEAGRRVVALSDSLVAVWDGQPAKGKGGTADIVDYARHLGKRVMVIWPHGVTR
ncbi:hypothetical protein FNH13_01020 [Ornithinimicrobium ciconiae]|uniref:Smf/DprA SLOG domain-containing protein n=1 Tax=Ornithinimicrobium ciconiae TaxID=2594265 RepID=A0A516G6F2_9MICO|nr:DNA-processing protein DprA [Ornithinimicrobium ciconiae]QDO87075.1 hypothetical protein FNH13_01020 [Ornithinimicrobium ciconiae]